jgi:hypothetical protein
MGKKQSKEEEPPPPAPVDGRWELSRNFGPKYDEYFAKQAELTFKRPEDIPRPVHVSNLNRFWPVIQGWYFHLGLLGFVFRKMPFTNPLVRMYFFILGVDLCRGRIRYMGIADKDDMKEVVTFPLMAFRLRNRCAMRVPDYVMEHEDWFEMNKPAYRVPISHERSFDSWMRYFLINRKQYALRPT